MNEEQIESLALRRREVFETIKNHPFISFDTLTRRFASTPSRTLSYDVYMLIKDGLVRKHGVTRGVCYSAVI